MWQLIFSKVNILAFLLYLLISLEQLIFKPSFNETRFNPLYQGLINLEERFLPEFRIFQNVILESGSNLSQNCQVTKKRVICCFL